MGWLKAPTRYCTKRGSQIQLVDFFGSHNMSKGWIFFSPKYTKLGLRDEYTLQVKEAKKRPVTIKTGSFFLAKTLVSVNIQNAPFLKFTLQVMNIRMSICYMLLRGGKTRSQSGEVCQTNCRHVCIGHNCSLSGKSTWHDGNQFFNHVDVLKLDIYIYIHIFSKYIQNPGSPTTIFGMVFAGRPHCFSKGF